MRKIGNPSFVVYIDESGDEGFTFREVGQKGSSTWFVMAAAIFHATSENQEGKRIEEVRKLIGKVGKPLHFKDLDHQKKVAYARIMARAKMQIVGVLVHKPSLTDQAASWRTKHQFYRYISKFLLERVSWACRDRFGEKSRPCEGDGTANIIFSNRRTMSYQDLKDYLNKLKNSREASIDWSVVCPDRVITAPHDKYRGLQIADLVASSLYSAVEPNRFGNTEDRYARHLSGMIYKWSNVEKRLGNGLKVWPSQAIQIFRDACDLLEY